MKWVKFFVLIQAILVLIFIIAFFFQISANKNAENKTINSSLENGYIPSSSEFDMSSFPKIAVLLIVIAVIEMIIITRMFE